MKNVIKLLLVGFVLLSSNIKAKETNSQKEQLDSLASIMYQYLEVTKVYDNKKDEIIERRKLIHPEVSDEVWAKAKELIVFPAHKDSIVHILTESLPIESMERLLYYRENGWPREDGSFYHNEYIDFLSVFYEEFGRINRYYLYWFEAYLLGYLTQEGYSVE